MKRLFVGLLVVAVLFALACVAPPEPTKVDVCHFNNGHGGSYNLISVSIHSVDDANGVGGHGSHENDAWRAFIFSGVTYPGQNVGLFGAAIDDECNAIVSTATPTATPVTPTATPITPTATPVTPTATPTATNTEEPTATATAIVTEPPATDTPTVTEIITQPPDETPTPTSTPTTPRKPVCTGGRIWVWELIDANGNHVFLRDLGYDGTYDAPGVAQQCYYFGCDFHAVTAWGSWVSKCDDPGAYAYWRALPRYNGGGKCPLQ